jgi:hypothetical protein
MGNNNKISKGCFMNPPAKSICNNGLFTIINPSNSTDYNALQQSNDPDPDKRPNEIPRENLSQSSQLNKEHSTSNISTALSKNQISASSCDLSKSNHLHEISKNQVSQRRRDNDNDYTDNYTNAKPTTMTTATSYNSDDPCISIHINVPSKSNYCDILPTTIFDVPALSYYVFPQNNPWFRLILFNLFPDHPG